MASMPFLALGFCEAKTYETYTAGLHAGGSLTLRSFASQNSGKIFAGAVKQSLSAKASGFAGRYKLCDI
jgi:hypothetical protein